MTWLDMLKGLGEILQAIGPTSTVILVLIFVIKNHQNGEKRDDIFRSQLLKSHAKAIASGERAVDNNAKIIELMRVHENAAKARAETLFDSYREQKELAKQQSLILARIAESLTSITSTKETIDNINETLGLAHGSVTGIRTDLNEEYRNRQVKILKGLVDIRNQVLDVKKIVQSKGEKDGQP